MGRSFSFVASELLFLDNIHDSHCGDQISRAPVQPSGHCSEKVSPPGEKLVSALLLKQRRGPAGIPGVLNLIKVTTSLHTWRKCRSNAEDSLLRDILLKGTM